MERNQSIKHTLLSFLLHSSSLNLVSSRFLASSFRLFKMKRVVCYDAEPNCSMCLSEHVVSMLNFDWHFSAHFVS